MEDNKVKGGGGEFGPSRFNHIAPYFDMYALFLTLSLTPVALLGAIDL